MILRIVYVWALTCMAQIWLLTASAPWTFAQNVATEKSVGSEPDCQCGKLARIQFPGAEITAAECISGGLYTPPGATQSMSELPPFCRVAARLRPAPDSHIRIEVWLPLKDWNGRLLGTGNGGGAGGIAYGALASGLKRGFATANTDMGTSPGANEAVGHPDKWVDFGHRGTHEMTVTAKAILREYYMKPLSFSYFAGCSTGGQQALMEAQRYPEDYNGILAGAPANNRTHLHTGFVWNFKATNEVPGSALPGSGLPGSGLGGKALLPKEKIAMITEAVIRACAGKDGGAPGDHFLTDPRACKFDPETLPKCPSGADGPGCLTPGQLTALKKIYAGPANPKTGEQIYTPIPLGSENSGAGIEYQQNPHAAPASLFYQYKWAFGREFDYATFDFDKDQDRLDSLLAPVLNANNPNLKPLRDRGGKLLMYAGTADPLVPYQDALNYYDRVVENEKGLSRTQEFFRFFVIPGMAHCGGGPGLNDCGQNLSKNVPQDSEHDFLTALVDWVENGKAPEKFVANAYVNADPKSGIRFKRPLYPYPLMPSYAGGDVNDANSFKPKRYPKRKVVVPAGRYLK